LLLPLPLPLIVLILVQNRIFYRLAGDILPTSEKTSPTHHFIRVLQDQDRLLRNYTQNIDNVEAYAGIDPAKLVQCHGSWATATCRKCSKKVDGSVLFPAIRSKEVARCQACETQLQHAQVEGPGTLKRKISAGNGWKPRKGGGRDDDDSDGEFDIPEAGIMKPDITFFGEKLPDRFFDTLQNVDREKVDLVIVIGTSMKVAPVSEIPNFVHPTVPQIYISRDVSFPLSS
jgi:NAD-dependent histone deacetylase SIR2